MQHVPELVILNGKGRLRGRLAIEFQLHCISGLTLFMDLLRCCLRPFARFIILTHHCAMIIESEWVFYGQFHSMNGPMLTEGQM